MMLFAVTRISYPSFHQAITYGCALKMVEEDMYVNYSQANKLALSTASESLSSTVPTSSASTIFIHDSPAARDGLSTGEGAAGAGALGSDPPLRKETKGTPLGLEMPGDWVYPYIILVCA